MTWRKNRGWDREDFYSHPGSKIFWVETLYCPKDDPLDDLPPFTPKYSRFALQQFTAGLHEGIWPPRMKVKVTYTHYTDYKNDQHKRHKKEIEYVIPKVAEQKELAGKMLTDSREFAKRTEKENGKS